MPTKHINLVYVCGLFSFLLGIIVLIGWLANIDALVSISPKFAPMVIGTAVCFVIAGFSLISSSIFNSHISSKILRIAGILITFISALFIVENIYDINLYIDLANWQMRLPYSRPGRMAPNSATGFLLFGIGLLILSYEYKQHLIIKMYRLISILASLVSLIGVIGILGYLLNLHELYTWMSLSGMAAHTAVGMLILGVGLFEFGKTCLHQASIDAYDGKRIMSTTIAVIVLIGISVSVLTFSALQERIEKVMQEDFSVRAENQSDFFYQIIAHRSERAIVLSKNQALVELVNDFIKSPDNKNTIEGLATFAKNIQSNGFEAISIELTSGEHFDSIPLRENVPLIFNLTGKYPNQLLWDKGFILKSRLPLFWQGKVIGNIIAEQSMPVLDGFLPRAIKWGDTVDVIICGVGDQVALECYPSRLNSMPFKLQKSTHGNKLPIVYAVENHQSGVMKVQDYRDVPVLAAYAPIGDTGLGMTQTIDLAEIYSPIKDQIKKVIAVTFLLLLAGYFLIRRQVLPLVKKIVAAQQLAQIENERFIAATEGGIDNFYIFEAVRDSANKIIDFRCLYINSAGSKLINQQPGEMVGKLLLEEVPINREKHLFDSYTYVIETGKTISEELAIDDAGVNASWIYWQVVKLGDGMAISSRDITEQKRLEYEVAKAERLHSAIIDSASYSIIATDKDGIIISINKAAERMLWYSESELAGKFTPEIIHDKDEVVSRAAALSAELGRDIKPGFEVFIAKASGDVPSEEEWSYIRKDGSRFPVKLSVTILRDKDKNVYGHLGIAYDISEQKRAEEYIKHIALHDVLTGLPNRALYDDRVRVAIERAKRNNEKVGIALLDLDHFKNVNDSLGHHIGDKLLQEVSRRLIKSIRPSDTVARMGGDEFAFLFPVLSYPEGALIILQKIHKEFEPRVEVNEHVLHISPSIGLSIYPDDGEDLDTLLMNADTAMYRAKELGRNGYQIFSRDMLQSATLKLSMEAQLREAINQNQFELFYQPQINLESMSLEGVEALIRWQKAPGVYCPPLEFIPLAEETGLIVPIGDWVIRTAIKQAKAFEQHFGKPIRMAVNISPRQFRHINLVPNILNTLREFDVSPAQLEVEITENLMMGDIENSVEVITKLRAEGIQLALDDFGTGYSSLSYLSKFKFDRIKIDQSFVKNCLIRPEDASLVKTIVGMSKALGIAIIAEGVETQEQLDFIKSNECDEAQGYFIGKPVSASQLLNYSNEGLLSLTESANVKMI